MTTRSYSRYIKVVLLAFLLPMATILTACNGPFNYVVHIVDQDTKRDISGAAVTIEVPGQAPLDEVTGNDGIAIIEIPGSHAGKTGRLIIEAKGAEIYRQAIALTPGTLPDTILILPSDPLPSVTPIPQPTAQTDELEATRIATDMVSASTSTTTPALDVNEPATLPPDPDTPTTVPVGTSTPTAVPARTSTPTPTHDCSEEVSNIYERAAENANNQNYDEAIIGYMEVISREPVSTCAVESHYNLGGIYAFRLKELSKEDYPEALSHYYTLLSDYEPALIQETEGVRAFKIYYNIAVVSRKLGECNPEAREYFGKVLEEKINESFDSGLEAQLSKNQDGANANLEQIIAKCGTVPPTATP